jgi:protein dithiol oxidoreductase (disulfide-forming)
MKRRDFSLALAGAGMALATSTHAQGGPVEGRDYLRLSTPAPTALAGTDKKVEVVEFFWYGCPACNAFEPYLESWAAKVPADVSFRRVHVGFSVPQQLHQKLFFTLERMGLLDKLHKRVFAAMHVQKLRLMNEADIVAWVKAQGVDEAEFTGLFRSMPVDSKGRQARALIDAYHVDGVPMIGVQGRYTTSGSMAGRGDRVLSVTDFLVQRARQGT